MVGYEFVIGESIRAIPVGSERTSKKAIIYELFAWRVFFFSTGMISRAGSAIDDGGVCDSCDQSVMRCFACRYFGEGGVKMARLWEYKTKIVNQSVFVDLCMTIIHSIL